MRLLPGYDNLVDKVPELGTPRGFMRALLSAVGSFLLVLAVFYVVEERSRFLVLVLQLGVYAIAYVILKDFFTPRSGLPYAEAFFNRYLVAAGLSLASLVYIIRTYRVLEDVIVPEPFQLLFALYLGVTGLIIAVAAARTLGADGIAGVHMYYPDEGPRVQSGAYSGVRHPVYAGFARIALALGILNGTPFALLLATVYVFAWLPAWIGLEESELVKRFGDEYREYQSHTPTLFPTDPEGELSLLRSALKSPDTTAEVA